MVCYRSFVPTDKPHSKSRQPAWTKICPASPIRQARRPKKARRLSAIHGMTASLLPRSPRSDCRAQPRHRHRRRFHDGPTCWKPSRKFNKRRQIRSDPATTAPSIRRRTSGRSPARTTAHPHSTAVKFLGRPPDDIPSPIPVQTMDFDRVAVCPLCDGDISS